MDQVLSTTEMLEAILLHLPPKDLLFSQRVSQQFRNTVKSSTRLQQVLFLAPEAVHRGPIRLNPFIPRLFDPDKPLIFEVDGMYMGLYDLVGWDAEDSYSRVTASLVQQGLVAYLSATSFRRYVTGRRTKLCLPGSWSGMYLCQPPCTLFFGVEASTFSIMDRQIEGATLGAMVREAFAMAATEDW